MSNRNCITSAEFILMHLLTPTDGFEKLVTQINIGVMYAQYVNHPIPYQEMVDTFIMVIMKYGLFNTSYQKWHARPDKNKTWTEGTVFGTRR